MFYALFLETQKYCILVYMVLFMMKSHLLDIKIDSQPALFFKWNSERVSVETPETHLDLPLDYIHSALSAVYHHY